MIRNSSVIFLDSEGELHQTIPVELVQPEQIGEHVHGINGFVEILDVEGIEIVVVDSQQLGRDSFFLHNFVLLLRAAVVVTENFQSHPVFLFGLPDFVVQLGMVKGQAAVHGKHLERLYVILGEVALVFVHHLDHSDYEASDEDRHAEDRVRSVT